MDSLKGCIQPNGRFYRVTSNIQGHHVEMRLSVARFWKFILSSVNFLENRSRICKTTSNLKSVNVQKKNILLFLYLIEKKTMMSYPCTINTAESSRKINQKPELSNAFNKERSLVYSIYMYVLNPIYLIQYVSMNAMCSLSLFYK